MAVIDPGLVIRLIVALSIGSICERIAGLKGIPVAILLSLCVSWGIKRYLGI